jgi:hypothetical protein
MDDEPGGLVDHQQVLVSEDDLEAQLERLEDPFLGYVELELLATRQAVALRAPLAVDEYRARHHEPLGQRPRPDLW